MSILVKLGSVGLWVSFGVRSVIGLPTGIMYSQKFYFKFPFGLIFRIKLGILVRLGRLSFWVCEGFGWL